MQKSIRKFLKYGLLGGLGLVLLSLVLLKSQGVLAARDVSLKVTFFNHLQAKLPEQDVFIESKNDKTKVIRVEGKDVQDQAVLAKQAYATAKATPHDPFKLGPNPLGPFDKGVKLGFTLGQWLAATGSGSYSVTGDKAEMKFIFKKLVPKGVYTVWCSKLTLPPNFKVIDKPCGAQDGSQNSFKADSKGNGSFNLSLDPLPDSSKETFSVIALAYHSDGKTHDGEAGDFGKTTHVQIFYLVPPPPETPSPTPLPATISPSPSQTPAPSISGKNLGWLILGLVIIIIIISLLARRKSSVS